MCNGCYHFFHIKWISNSKCPYTEILNQDKPQSAGIMTYSSEQPKYRFVLKWETIVFDWITLITWKIVEGESIRTVEFAHLGDCWLHCFLLMLETNRPRSMDMEMKNVRKPPLSPASVKACIKWIDQAWIMIIQIISWK